MMSEESYQLAWMVYVAAALISIAVVYEWFLRRLPTTLGLCLVVFALALLLTPTGFDADYQGWAPTVVVVGFELLTDGVDSALQRSRSVAVTAVTGMLPILLWSAVRRFRRGAAEAG